MNDHLLYNHLVKHTNATKTTQQQKINGSKHPTPTREPT